LRHFDNIFKFNIIIKFDKIIGFEGVLNNFTFLKVEKKKIKLSNKRNFSKIIVFI